MSEEKEVVKDKEEICQICGNRTEECICCPECGHVCALDAGELYCPVCGPVGERPAGDS
jgi:hypothetical protein